MGKPVKHSKRTFCGNQFVKKDVRDISTAAVPGRKRGRPLNACFSVRPTDFPDVRPFSRNKEQGGEGYLPTAQSTPKSDRGTSRRSVSFKKIADSRAQFSSY